MMSPILARSLIVLLVVMLAAGAGYLGMWVADRDTPVEIRAQRVITPEVLPGNSLTMEYEVNRIRHCRSRVERTIYDGQKVRHVLGDNERNASEPLGPGTFRTTPRVPEIAAPGEALYYVASSYVCNPTHLIWPIVVIQPEATFTIRAGREGLAKQ